MNKARPKARPPRCAPQITLSFIAEMPLEERVRAEALALLSRLLLQVAQARSEAEGADDRP
jgi:hypothetical protein